MLAILTVIAVQTREGCYCKRFLGVLFVGVRREFHPHLATLYSQSSDSSVQGKQSQALNL